MSLLNKTPQPNQSDTKSMLQEERFSLSEKVYFVFKLTGRAIILFIYSVKNITSTSFPRHFAMLNGKFYHFSLLKKNNKRENYRTMNVSE